MSQRTRKEVLEKLRRRYKTAGEEHKRKLLDQAVQMLGYHRKAAIRALGRAAVERGPLILTGRPVEYEANLLVPQTPLARVLASAQVSAAYQRALVARQSAHEPVCFETNRDPKHEAQLGDAPIP